MKRTTISVDDNVFEDMERVAAERGITVAELVREAVEEKLATCPGATGEQHRERPRRLPKSLGAGASGYSDTSELISEGLPELPPWH